MVLKNSGLARARILAKRRLLFTRIVLQILFRISQSNGKKEIHEIRIWISQLKSTLRTDFSQVKSVFGFRVRLGNSDLDFENLNPDFPIERTLRVRVSNPPGSPIPKYWSSTTPPRQSSSRNEKKRRTGVLRDDTKNGQCGDRAIGH